METISVGKQLWMKSNLNVDKFNNGDIICEADTKEKWREAFLQQEPAWCHYENNPENGEKFGKIYNIHALYDPRGLAPQGFSIPTQNDISTFYEGFWNKLFDRRTVNTDDFQKGGIRNADGDFMYINEMGFYFCTNEKNKLAGFAVPNGVKIETLNGFYIGLNDNGRYVKCVKR